MASAVVTVALRTIGDLLVEEGKFLHGVGSAVKALQRRLREMRCLLEDADSKQHQSKIVRNWIKEIRDLTYRAEDAIAAHAVKCSSCSKRRLLLHGYTHHKLRSEISKITSDFAKVTEKMQGYGIRSIIEGAESSGDDLNLRRKTFPDFYMENCFVGKEDELERLVSLVAGDNQHRVISVWGMGGIGKTTIAKKVYKHMIEANSFESLAWVCITQQCQTRSLLEDVLNQLAPEKVGGVTSLSHTQLIQQLLQIQREKRCLIVLDDIWETSHWTDGLKHAFFVDNLKSKILVTTRKQDVANIGLPFELRLLIVDDAWELLKKKTFPHPNIPEYFAIQESEFSIIGKEMVQKCGGLPLAISLLGGVLREKNSTREWELVNENMDSYLYRGEGHDEIDAVLNLSYDNLPHHLKLCFLYLGVLREDESIGVGDLYRVWIALGLISNENSGGIEPPSSMEVAEGHLSELASRSIVQVELVDKFSPKNKYKTCKLHDVVRVLCLFIGRKESYRVQVLEYREGSFSALLRNALSRIETRHLVIYFKTEPQGDDDEFTIIGEEDSMKHLRSLHIHNEIKGSTNIEFPSTVDFRKFKSLRSLAFTGFKFVGGKLPRGITHLVHLRNLRFRSCEVDELPSSIGNLVYLEILDLLSSRNTRIPNVLKKMTRLQQLLLPHYDMARIGDYRLGLGEGLDELESLMGFNSSVHENSGVTRMKKLRRFSSYICDNESFSAILNAIAKNWNKLVYTFVVVEERCQLTSTEVKQAFTCRNLDNLAIHVRLGNLLAECRSDVVGSNLVGSLCLTKSQIEDDPMEILGNLSSLTQLCFHSESFIGEVMTCPALSFPRLKLLKLIDLAELREWRVDGGAMPTLSKLHICGCRSMEMVPQGLSGIFTLQQLTIKEMPELKRRVSASGDGGEGEDFHKVRHVRSIIIID